MSAGHRWWWIGRCVARFVHWGRFRTGGLRACEALLAPLVGCVSPAHFHALCAFLFFVSLCCAGIAKVLVVGNVATGKTSVINRFARNKFSKVSDTHNYKPNAARDLSSFLVRAAGGLAEKHALALLFPPPARRAPQWPFIRATNRRS
jgi:hypothetical protein